MRSFGKAWLAFGLVPLVVGSLAGCLGDSEAKIPTIPYDGPVLAYGSTIEIERIEVDGNWLCPITSDGDLLVLPSGGTGDLSNKTITIEGVTFKAGDMLEIGANMPLEGGFDCGSKHFDNARQLQSPDMEVLQE